MDKIREQLRNPLVAAGVGFVVGLIIGLVVLGWGLWPVQWKDAAPSHLRQDAKVDYLCMAIQSFAKDQRADQAASRWQELGKQAAATLIEVNSTNCPASQADLMAFQTVVKSSVSVIQPTQTTGTEVKPTTAVGAVKPTKSATTGKPASSSPVLLVVACGLVLLIGGALAYILLFRNRRGEEGKPPVARAQEMTRPSEPAEVKVENQDAACCAVHDHLHGWR